jgi:hypothetical protein
LNLPPLAALRKEMQRRIAEVRLADVDDAPANGLTDEPINAPGNGLTSEPINGGKWAHLPNGNGLICSSLMGSPVSHIHGKSTRLKHTGGERHSHAPLNTRAREAPPSASAASLPVDNNERERAKKAPAVRRSKKTASLSQGDALTAAEVRGRIERMTTVLRSYGITKGGAVPVAIRKLASDSRVSHSLFDDALRRYLAEGDRHQRVRSLVKIIEDMLNKHSLRDRRR